MKRGFTTKRAERHTQVFLCVAETSAGRKTVRGFTLVETIITFGISVMALIALVNLFFVFNAIYGYQQAFMATAGSAGAAMNALEAAVLPASQVLASRDLGGTAFASDADTLVLELPSIDGTGAVIAGAKDYVAFYASGATLYRLTETAAPSARLPGTKQLSATLSSLSFTYDDADFTRVTNVTADIETRAQFKQQTVQSRLFERMYLRNYQSPL